MCCVGENSESQAVAQPGQGARRCARLWPLTITSLVGECQPPRSDSRNCIVATTCCPCHPMEPKSCGAKIPARPCPQQCRTPRRSVSNPAQYCVLPATNRLPMAHNAHCHEAWFEALSRPRPAPKPAVSRSQWGNPTMNAPACSEIFSSCVPPPLLDSSFGTDVVLVQP